MHARFSDLNYDVLNPPPFSTTIVGTTGPETLIADNQGDVVQAGTGSDIMMGGTGDDLFRDGPGADTIIGGGGFDRLSFSFWAGSATQGVVASLATQTVYDDGHGNVEHLSGIESLGAGTLFRDVFIGDDNPNFLWGDTGDTLLGLGGGDVIQVGGAPALVDGGSGVNTLVMGDDHLVANGRGVREQTDDHGATVDLARGLIVDAGDGSSGLVRNIQDVDGGPLNDVIVGDRNDNVIAGLAGDDTLTGGGGHDVFLYTDEAFDTDGNPNNGHDVITDFNRGLDKIDFDVAGVKGMGDLTITHDAHGDVVVGYGDIGETITLLGVHHVNQTDFLFML